MAGYIKYYRQIEKDEFFHDPISDCIDFEKFGWWSFMLLKANYQSMKTKKIIGKMITINPGECYFSKKTWERLLGMSNHKLDNWFDLLIEDGKVSVETITNNGRTTTTKVTILNWHKWQDDASTLSSDETIDLQPKNAKVRDANACANAGQEKEGLKKRKRSNVISENDGMPESLFKDEKESSRPEENLKEKREKSSAEKEKKISYTEYRKQCIAHLNELMKQNISHNSVNAVKLMRKVYDDNITVEQVKAVISDKYREWSSEKKSRKWIRVSTLFTGKFYEYLEQVPDSAIKSPSRERTAAKMTIYREHYKPNMELKAKNGNKYIFSDDFKFLTCYDKTGAAVGKMTVEQHFEQVKEKLK